MGRSVRARTQHRSIQEAGISKKVVRNKTPTNYDLILKCAALRGKFGSLSEPEEDCNWTRDQNGLSLPSAWHWGYWRQLTSVELN